MKSDLFTPTPSLTQPFNYSPEQCSFVNPSIAQLNHVIYRSVPVDRPSSSPLRIVHLFVQRVQGWRSGESTRLPPMWPGFDSQTQRHMWVEFVGFLLCNERFFSGYPGFPLSSKKKKRLFYFDLIISIYNVPY